MKRPGSAVAIRPSAGFTLVELVVAAGLSAVLVFGLVQTAVAVSSSTMLQDNQAQLLDRARFAVEMLSRAVRNAGFSPEHWNATFRIDHDLVDSADGTHRYGDRLVLFQWSDRNCFDNRNPSKDAGGNALFFYRETTFELNGSKHLSLQCRYGPSKDKLVRQINRQGVVRGVESFQLLFAVDENGDGTFDRWIKAGGQGDDDRLIGVRFGLLLSSDDAVLEPGYREFEILEEHLAFRDGRLRRVFEFEVALRSRV